MGAGIQVVVGVVGGLSPLSGQAALAPEGPGGKKTQPERDCLNPWEAAVGRPKSEWFLLWPHLGC